MSRYLLALTGLMALACGGGAGPDVSDTKWKIEWLEDGSRQSISFISDGTARTDDAIGTATWTASGDTVSVDLGEGQTHTYTRRDKCTMSVAGYYPDASSRKEWHGQATWDHPDCR